MNQKQNNYKVRKQIWMFIQIKQKSKCSSTKIIQGNEQNYLIERIARIDGNQTVKRYKKCELLGRGGFANCFTTQNLQTKKRSATKVIQKQLLTTQKTKLRLLNQIRLHKTLHHENVVQFQHYFQDKNNVYIFLELCENQSLSQLIKTRQCFSTPQIQSFIYGIVQGLKYLHGKSIMHRDLKLGNIFLDKNFKIKLGDFGLATKLQFRKQCKRTICGTPNYIAPEILEGKGYHLEIDIWSIGVILYTSYYKVAPFETCEALLTYHKIKKCQYTIPKSMLVPDEAIDLIKKILVKNPAERPTLNEILKSDFMKLGNQIYKQLPSICSKRVPGKSDLANMAYYTYDQIISLNRENQKPIQVADQKVAKTSKLQFITKFQALGEDKYYYMLSNGISSIFTPSQVIFKDQFGVIKSFNPNDQVKIIKNAEQNPLKYLLSCKTKLNSSERQQKTINSSRVKQKEVLFGNHLYPSQTPLHINKVSQQTKHGLYMIRLSNQTIQLKFENNVDFLISGKGQQIYEIKNGKVTYMFVLEEKFVLSKENLSKIQPSKVKYICTILNQIKSMKQKVAKNGSVRQIKIQAHKSLTKSESTINYENESLNQPAVFKQANI